MFRLLRLISYPQLRASWGRTLLVVSGIATGVTLMVAINVINASIAANYKHTLELMAGPASLEVTLGLGEVGFDEDTVEIVRKHPAVVAAVPLVRGTVALADGAGETLQLFGADLTAEEDLARYHVTTNVERRELLKMMEDPHAVLVASTFATRHGLGPGSTLRLSMPTGVVDVTVRGVLEAEGLAAAFDGQVAVMDLPAVQILLNRQGRIDQIDLVLREGSNVATVRDELDRVLPSTLTVSTPLQRGAQYDQVLASFQAMLTGISTICLIAGIYIIYNTTSTGAAQRAGTIAGLRLVGADPRQLFRLLMMEALVLGVTGAISGTVIGIIFAKLLTGMVAESMGVIYKLRFPTSALAVNPSDQAVIALIGTIAALVASYFAARRLTTREPLEVLRVGAISDGAPRSGVLLLAWLALIVVSAGALVLQEYLRSILWGNIAAALWNASVIVVAVPLVRSLMGVLSRVLPRLFPAEGRVALASLFRTSTRTGVSVAAIALVLTIAIMLTSLSISFRDSAANYLGKLFAADLIVSAVSTEGGYLETPLPAQLAHDIATVPGVRDVESGRVVSGQLYRGRRIGILALSDGLFEGGGDTGGYPPSWYRDGDPRLAGIALRKGEGVNVSTALADEFGLRVGDTIDLDAPAGPFSSVIVGVVPDYISDRGSVIMNRTAYARYWRDDTVTRINVYLEPGQNPAEVREHIAKRFGGTYVLKILSLRQLLEYHDEYRRRAFAFTDAIQLLIVIVAIAGIFDLLISAIIERRRELAVWRLIGADSAAVRRAIVIESMTIGILGSALGVVVGFVTAWLWIRFNFRYLLGYHLEFRFPTSSAVWYSTLVISVTLLVGYLAARRATHAAIIEGIQIE